jgi:hypothetical protein
MGDLKVMVQGAEASAYDGARGISPKEFETLKAEYRQNHLGDKATIDWLEKTHGPLATALGQDLDYETYTGMCNSSIYRGSDNVEGESLNRYRNLDRLPSLSNYDSDGLPKNIGASAVTQRDDSAKNPKFEYHTGSNLTRIEENSCAVDDAQAKASRGAQYEFVSRMNGVVGYDRIKNPPTVEDAKLYFQKMADKGASPAQIRDEYGKFTSTFYKPAEVDWEGKPAGLDVNRLDEQFKDQPIIKDGRRLIDCEGFSGMSEKVLGGIKRRDGQPMFDVVHAGSSRHAVAGVFEHGGDARRGFIVNNNKLESAKFNGGDADFRQLPEAKRRSAILATWMSERRGEQVREMGDTYGDQVPVRDWERRHP